MASGEKDSSIRFAPGTTVQGSYRIDALIGQGGMSIVYAATHIASGHRVAIKALPPEQADDRGARLRLMREAQMGARVAHPNIVEIVDLGIDSEGQPFIVAELLEGETLASLLSRASDKFSLEEFAALVLPFVDALAVTHELGIVHRDIKPENIFLKRNDDGTTTPKLVDFGIAKKTHRDPDDSTSLTLPGTALGTPHYIAPEQALGNRDVDPRSDVWSLGVLFYRLLVGRVPFDSTKMGGLLNLVMSATPATPASAGVAMPVSDVVMKCLSKDLEVRYADAREVKNAVCEALGLPPSAGAPAHATLPPIRIASVAEPALTVRPPRPAAMLGGSISVPRAAPTARQTATTREVFIVPKVAKPTAQPISEPAKEEQPAPNAMASVDAPNEKPSARATWNRWLVIGALVLLAIAFLLGRVSVRG